MFTNRSILWPHPILKLSRFVVDNNMHMLCVISNFGPKICCDNPRAKLNKMEKIANVAANRKPVEKSQIKRRGASQRDGNRLEIEIFQSMQI